MLCAGDGGGVIRGGGEYGGGTTGAECLAARSRAMMQKTAHATTTVESITASKMITFIFEHGLRTTGGPVIVSGIRATPPYSTHPSVYVNTGKAVSKADGQTGWSTSF